MFIELELSLNTIVPPFEILVSNLPLSSYKKLLSNNVKGDETLSLLKAS